MKVPTETKKMKLVMEKTKNNPKNHGVTINKECSKDVREQFYYDVTATLCICREQIIQINQLLNYDTLFKEAIEEGTSDILINIIDTVNCILKSMEDYLEKPGYSYYRNGKKIYFRRYVAELEKGQKKEKPYIFFFNPDDGVLDPKLCQNQTIKVRRFNASIVLLMHLLLLLAIFRIFLLHRELRDMFRDLFYKLIMYLIDKGLLTYIAFDEIHDKIYNDLDMDLNVYILPIQRQVNCSMYGPIEITVTKRNGEKVIENYEDILAEHK